MSTTGRANYFPECETLPLEDLLAQAFPAGWRAVPGPEPQDLRFVVTGADGAEKLMGLDQVAERLVGLQWRGLTELERERRREKAERRAELG